MNYIPIHTNIAPNYNYLSAENAFLRQNIEYKDAVLCQQQETINKLQADVDQLSQANMQFKTERDRNEDDARRWRVMKNIIRTQGTDQALYVVQKTVDKDLENERARRKTRVE
jgi:cell division protein FtsB